MDSKPAIAYISAMPELPEVETTRRGIAPALEGRAVRELVVRERRLRWPVPDGIEHRVLDGVELEDGRAAADAAARLPASEGAVLLVTLHEGRNREIRRMMDELGAGIRYLRRLSVGPVELGDLEPGSWRELGEDEVAALRRAASGEEPASEANRTPSGRQ